jgi:hypothetical protein
MADRIRLLVYFSAAGLLGGAWSTFCLSKLVFPAALSTRGAALEALSRLFDTWPWFAFPVVGAACSAIWARIVRNGRSGFIRDAIVALLACLSFDAVHGLVVGHFTAIAGFASVDFLVEGGVWILLGAGAGWLYSRHTAPKRSNPTMQSIANGPSVGAD